jgi:hypothetical protein
MAITASQLNALTDFTWAQIKLACKTAMVNSVLGGAQLSINGRTIGRVSMEDLTKLYQFADANEQIESVGEGGMAALVDFGEAQ